VPWIVSIVFLNEEKDLPFSLFKKKRVSRLISGKQAKNQYKYVISQHLGQIEG
jgi:hypothetical protein